MVAAWSTLSDDFDRLILTPAQSDRILEKVEKMGPKYIYILPGDEYHPKCLDPELEQQGNEHGNNFLLRAGRKIKKLVICYVPCRKSSNNCLCNALNLKFV